MANAAQDFPEFKGDNLSVKMFGAVPDGVIVFDGAINSGSSTFTSAAMADTDGGPKAPVIGQIIWIEGAGPGGLDILSTITSINSPSSVEIATPASTAVSNAEGRYGTDNTIAFQSAQDACAALNGRRLSIPGGIYLTTASVNLRSHVTLHGDGWAYDVYNGLGASTIACCADVPVLQNIELVTGDGWVGGNIRQLNFRGTSRTGSKGIYSQLSLGTHLEYCAFDHFGDQAIHLDNGIFGIHIIGCFATGSCLVRTGRTDYVGVFDIRPSDIFMTDCEVGCSTSNDRGGEYGDGFIAAFKISGTNCFIRDCMGHHSQIGFYVGPTTAPQVTTTFINCRADQNQGHGWVIDAYFCSFIGCRSHMNYLDADGQYDAFHVINGNHYFHNCQGTTAGDGTGIGDPHNNRYRDIFHFSSIPFFAPSIVDLCAVGDTFTLNRGPQVCTRDAYHVEAGTRPPLILDFEGYAEPAGLKISPPHVWMESPVADPDARLWSIGTQVPGLDNTFNIAAWNDARSSFVFPFSIVRDTTTGDISYISFRDAGFVHFDSSIVFVDCRPTIVFSNGTTYNRPASFADERSWNFGPAPDDGSSGSGEFWFVAQNDLTDIATVWMRVHRVGPNVDKITLNAPTIEALGTLKLDGGGVGTLGTGRLVFAYNNIDIITSSGHPEGSVTASPGSILLDANGLIWVKATGSGNTGWTFVMKAPSAGLTNHGVLIGAGYGDMRATSPGTLGMFLQSGGAVGDPDWAKVDLASAAQVTGYLPVGNLGGGFDASSTTFWRGDGIWAPMATSGVTQSVTFVTTITPGTSSLQYKDWAGVNQTMVVVNGLSTSYVTANFVDGVWAT